MERSPRLVDLYKQHSENDYTTKSNLHVQCISYQNPNGFHHRELKINPKFDLEAQNIMNSQSNTEKRKQHWRYHNT
jgi:hypothetical protein